MRWSPSWLTIYYIKLAWTRGVGVNMPACHAGDRRFESGRVRHLYTSVQRWIISELSRYIILLPYWIGKENNLIHPYGSIAQSVEQRTENPRVGGSIPSRATIMHDLEIMLFLCRFLGLNSYIPK